MPNNIKKQFREYTQSLQDRVYDLSQYSHARVGLGHTGGHLKLNDWMAFQKGFAQAKDAVFSVYITSEVSLLCKELHLTNIEIESQVTDATQFLLRPDLGRLISVDSEKKLNRFINQHPQTRYKDLLIVISGGLSPIAIQNQLPQFLPHFINQVELQQWTVAPIIINPKGRVALGDQLNQYFKAKLVIILIGERPGLSSSDSMGIYFTYDAKPGCTDEKRNCISNIHQHGLPYPDAVSKLIYLLKKALISNLSGVMLKDDFHEKKLAGLDNSFGISESIDKPRA